MMCLRTRAGTPPAFPAPAGSVPSGKAQGCSGVTAVHPPSLCLCLTLSPPRQRGCSELGTLASWPPPGPRSPQKTPPHRATPQTLPSPLCPRPHAAPAAQAAIRCLAPRQFCWFLRVTNAFPARPLVLWLLSSLMAGQGPGTIVSSVPTHLVACLKLGLGRRMAVERRLARVAVQPPVAWEPSLSALK